MISAVQKITEPFDPLQVPKVRVPMASSMVQSSTELVMAR
jgi:hypothetical protein